MLYPPAETKQNKKRERGGCKGEGGLRANHWKINKKGVSLWGRSGVHLQRTTLECTCTGTRATGTKKFIDRATQPGEITEFSGRPETVGRGKGLPRIAPRRMEIGSPTKFPLLVRRGCRLSAILRAVIYIWNIFFSKSSEKFVPFLRGLT